MEGALYDIEHVTRYAYSRPAHRCVMALCLKPRQDRGQRLLRFGIDVRPSAVLGEERDCFGNEKHVFNVHRPHDHLVIAARARVRPAPPDAVPDSVDPSAWEGIRAREMPLETLDFVLPSALAHASPLLDSFVSRIGIRPGRDPLSSLRALSDTLFETFSYVPQATTAESSIDHILETGEGICQDYAHVMIAIARSWGIPARYVSGYLHVPGGAGSPMADNATHAWVECQVPGLGWIGFDPTNRTLADEHHVRIAHGRDYRDVSPTRGVIQGGGETRLEVTVGIEVREGPDGDGEAGAG